ncbi:hypothetical protein SAMN04488021_11561 [Paracoccus aminovorans]|uniref:Peptidase propeptide and YPEB domain-containing protein n=1 Tax=Paracoccus aminovorans TaxID=34004 RepID=A0A1I3AJP8_9RHOB|nr:hypothetical protein [Paracoccus aminovorans]CQR86554.1 hypothetical protein JCM7685_1991 [Paracoccus aminovorans]SFH50304.1 hypothetical protein SAMN04488021_11561 [Paracoccus aminovorans]
MFMKPLKIAALIALPILGAGSAMAASVTVVQQYPLKESQQQVDHALTEQLTKQGFADVSLHRGDGQITVSGVRQDEQLTLIYDAAHGQLTQVNGEPALLQTTIDDAMKGHDAS